MKLGVIALLAAILVSGCASGDQDSSQDHAMTSAQIEALAEVEQKAGHDDQAAVLEDGAVDSVEYDATFNALEKCLTERGFVVTSPVVSPVNGLRYEFSADFGARDQVSALADMDDCEAVHWNSVAQAYESSNEAVMDPTLSAAAASCLQERGHSDATEESSVARFVSALGENAVDDVVQCVQDEGSKLFPDLPSLTVGY